MLAFRGKSSTAIVVAAAWLLLPAKAIAQSADNLTLEQVVLLSRHGVRSPTQSIEDLDRSSESPWARWPVAPGELTPTGAGLMRLMGGFYRSIYSRQGLLPRTGCPEPGSIAAWADVDQRTRASGRALLEGLFPGCGLREQHQHDIFSADPIFHPVRAGTCDVRFERAKHAIMGRIGGSFTGIVSAYARQLGDVQTVLCPSRVSMNSKECGLWNEPSSFAQDNHGILRLRGPIAKASTAVEIFLLETAEGMDREKIAWGRLLDDAALRDLLIVHTLQFDLMNRTRYLAQRQGSNLLATIIATIKEPGSFPGATGPRPPMVALMVGHDTNISEVASLLGVEWIIEGFQRNQASPGGALAFEVIRNPKTGDRFIRLVYYAQTLRQMRQLIAIDEVNPAGRAPVALPACAEAAIGNACPLARFLDIASAQIDSSCITVGGRQN